MWKTAWSSVLRPLILALGLVAPPTGMAGAQNYNPQTDSLLNLLAAPEDGVAYHRAKVRARALVEAGDGAAATPLAEQLTRDYPRDGENWFLLARARALLNQHAPAAAAYESAISILGWNPVAFIRGPNSRYVLMIEAAGHHLAAGDRRAALDLLRKGVFEHQYPFPGELYDEPALAALRQDREFLDIIGRPDTDGWSRDYGWRRDVEHLYRVALQVRPVSRDRPLPAEFAERYEALKHDIPHLSDEEILVRMNGMLAVLHQGHTWLKGLQGSRIGSGALPVQFALFPEGLFIIDAIEAHRALIGSRVLRIGGMAADEALRKMSEIGSVDGDMQHLTDAVSLLRRTAFLKGIGAMGSLESVPLTVARPSQRQRTVTLNTPDWAPSGKLISPPGVSPPLYLRNLSETHWDQALPEHDAHYIQLNNVFDEEDETLAQFGRRLRPVLAQGNARNLIVDLRHNNGGNTALYRELLRTAVGFSQLPARRVYVLVGRWTYSAAANLATDLERLADALFVGEPTSECCNFFGDATPVVLPYSRITGALSAVRWNLSHDVFDSRREISADVPIQLTASDYFAGRDPVLETVFRMIATPEVQPGE